WASSVVTPPRIPCKSESGWRFWFCGPRDIAGKRKRAKFLEAYFREDCRQPAHRKRLSAVATLRRSGFCRSNERPEPSKDRYSEAPVRPAGCGEKHPSNFLLRSRGHIAAWQCLRAGARRTRFRADAGSGKAGSSRECSRAQGRAFFVSYGEEERGSRSIFRN